ncbi:amidohydrolase family protein [Streptomyces sp. NPDC054933]
MGGAGCRGTDVDDLGAYVTATLLGYAPVYRPEDMYTGTKLAALDSGITTMLDFSHNSRTPAHSDAAVQALVDSGIRGVHAAMGPHFGEWDRQWPADLARLQDHFGSGLLTFRPATLATDEIAGPDLAYGSEIARLAKELGMGVSVDAVFGASSSQAILEWERQGLLGPDLTLIHSTGLTGVAWSAIGGSGTTISLAPTSDAQIGLESAIPAVGEALSVGVRPGLSIDVEVALASDMFTQMRALHAIQRMRAVNAAYGTDREPVRIGTADVLDFATLQGARTNGLQDVVGSLTPGKQADLLVITAEEITNMPLNDAVCPAPLRRRSPRPVDSTQPPGTGRGHQIRPTGSGAWLCRSPPTDHSPSPGWVGAPGSFSGPCRGSVAGE